VIPSLVALSVLRLGLRLEVAPEYDTNANRVEESAPASPVATFLVRGAARGRLAYTRGPFALRVSLDGGTKIFVSDAARAQDTAVVRALVDAGRRFERGSVQVAGEYLDSFQWNACPAGDTENACHRDLRLATLRLGGAIVDGDGGARQLGIEGSVRRYEWKPAPDQSFLGLGAQLAPSLRLLRTGEDEERHDLSLGISGRVEWRRFDGGALLTATDLGGDPDATVAGGPFAGTARPRRSDLAATLGLSLAYTGRVVAGAGWLVETDRSNSVDGTYLFQMVTARLAVPLPARFTVAMRAQLLFFASGRLSSALAADEENRDALLLDVAREMGAGFTLSARYLVVRSASGDTGHDYLRQVVSLSLAWSGEKVR
jgi:hypothetical protein